VFKAHLSDNRQWLLERLAKEKDMMQVREIQGQIFVIDNLFNLRDHVISAETSKDN
jgi:hypothetical protein